ncbi:MAG: Lipoprotein, putative [uncultured Sulfurovum sp.]|uniref:Lipoprotein, putative n=1 Tax=uncultured Sulfurovum sp. TaxID=269237 RepID=A0A6S6SR42_9BACT|nr:MAG: Lipoprotein, putative [uncultured Sulfurovum sp.]
MEALVKIIKKNIEEHILDINHTDYQFLTEILGETELKKLSFYLESEQNKAFHTYLTALINQDADTKKALLALYHDRLDNSPIKKNFEVSMKEGETCTLFYGTNREPKDANNLSKGYGNERSHQLRLGSCQVTIPIERSYGQTTGSLWQKIINLDPSYGDIQLSNLMEYTQEAYWQNITNTLAHLEAEEQQALVFIHGFNTSFEEAAMRATQISVDLEHIGITAFFSWASQAASLSYISDSATIQYSERHLTQFLTDFAQNSGAKRIHIIAHSMGNRALLEAVNRINTKNPEIQFGQIILAAPDVDADVFTELSTAYTKLSEQTTLYISKRDKAVGLSKWLHSHNRAGFTPPVCMVDHINTIEVEEEVNLLELGHGYFAQHQSLLNDMRNLLHFNLDANNRNHLQHQKVSAFHGYWKIKGE